MSIHRLTGAALAALSLAACATAAPPPVATPADIPALEAAAAAAPGSADTLTLLGVAYATADRHEDAARTLARAAALPDAPAVASLYLGLSLEELARWADARAAYAAYLDSGEGDGDLRADVAGRVALADRMLLEIEAERLLAQEAALSALPPEPRSVAVVPVLVTTTDARYAPLQLALADMVTTDLNIPGVLVLLERAQIDAIVREMALGLGGFADEESSARVGRLMRAENVVQGSVTLLEQDRVRLDAALLDAASRNRLGDVNAEGPLEQLFDAEKQLVFGVLEALGVTLTPAEREAIEENRAANLIAFLSYGDGLMAMERGDFAAAAAAFGRAVQADPGFAPAAAAQQEAAELQQAAETSTDEIALDAAPELPGGAGAELDSRRNALNDVVDRTNPNPGSQYTGDDAGQDVATAGFDDDDTSNDPDEGFIAGPVIPSAGIDIDIPNPTQP